MEQTENRLIELIKTRIKPNEKKKFIEKLIKDGVSKSLIEKFKTP